MKEFIQQNKKFLIVAVLVVIAAVAFLPNLSPSSLPGAGFGGSKDELMSPSSLGMNRASEQPMAAPEMMAYDSSDGYSESKMASPDYYPVPPPVPGSDQGIATEDRMIIRSAYLTVEVDAPEKTFEEVKVYIDSVKGFIENANVSEYYNPRPEPYYNYDTYGGAKVAPYDGYDTDGTAVVETEKQKMVTATIRIPEDKFSEAVLKFKAYGYVVSESINGEDVTATYQDTKSQLENLRGRETKLREFYAQAKNVEDTLRIFDELEQIRYQIESLENQQKNLERRSGFATISLTLQPRTIIEPFSSGEWNIGKVWKEAVNSLNVALRSLSEVGVKLVVYAVIWVPIVLVLWLVNRWMKRRKKAQG